MDEIYANEPVEIDEKVAPIFADDDGASWTVCNNTNSVVIFAGEGATINVYSKESV